MHALRAVRSVAPGALSAAALAAAAVARRAPTAAAHHLHTSVPLALPRARSPRARAPSESVVSVDDDNAADKKPDAATAQTPWFMQEEVVDEPEPVATGAPIAWVPSYLPATADIPDTVATLFDMLISGTLSPLIARPREPASDEWGDVVRASPIAAIRPIPLGDGDMMTSLSWIFVVETRSNNPGAVRRVASEIGTYLKHTRAPAPETPPSLDDILGTPVYHDTGTPVVQPAQKAALAGRFPDAWSKKSISNEAHIGIQLLHETDPERFSAPVIARRFGISPQYVRKLLDTRPRTSTEAAARANRRARVLESMRRNARRADDELDELESIRRTPNNTPQLDMSINNPVRYEGLVSASDLNRRQKGIATRGSGDWCLIDAEWCIVHVMTADARARFRIEDVWRRNGAP